MDLEQALRKTQVSDLAVPADWEGARIILDFGSTITTEWSHVPQSPAGEIEWSRLTLVQCLQPRISAPPAFDLKAFIVLGLRASHIGREKALLFAQHVTTAPALLLAGQEKLFGIREIGLRKGPATVIEEFGALNDQTDWFGFSDGPKVDRLTLLWSASERLYMLRGELNVPRGMTSIGLATALTNAVNLANTID